MYPFDACEPRGVRPRWVVVVGVLASAVVLTTAVGCARRSTMAEGSARLVVSARPYARDIPVPVGFKLVERSSEDWVTPGLRYVRHRYEGRADKADLRSFYRAQMPLVRWSQTSDASVHGRYTMRFTRGTETCTVEISGAEPGVLGRVIVDVLITPAGRSAPAG